MPQFFTVDITTIHSNIPRSNFNPEDLEELASKILESDGLLQPIILKKTGFEQYEVVEGHLEHYAALVAKQKNPRKGEMVNALVISNEELETALEQISILNKLKNNTGSKEVVREGFDLVEPDRVNYNFEASNNVLEKNVMDLRNMIGDLRTIVNDLKDKIQKKDKEIQSIKNSLPKKNNSLNTFNHAEKVDLAFKLRSAGMNESKAIKIAEAVEKERNKKEFTSLSEISNRIKIPYGKRMQRGISPEKMLDIIETWSKIMFL